MFFRPEEVNPASSMGEIFAPVSNRDINIGTNARRVLAFDHTVTHHHAHKISAVQTWRLDHGCLPREKPADRQRLESSLREPFLLSIHGDAVLRGQVVEGRKGGNQIGAREKPDWQRKRCSHQCVQQPFAFLCGYRKRSGDLSKVWGLTPPDEAFHNEVVCSIQLLCVNHISSFPA
jgi:hypothetical protein